MAITPTPNMNLEKPAKGDTPWDVPVNNNWDDIDAHDHTPGKGVLVPTAGLLPVASSLSCKVAGCFR